MFNFEYEGKNITVNDAPEDFDGWTIKKSESLSYDKAEVIVTKFEEEFPDMKLLGDSYNSKYDFLTKVVSRSKPLLQWFAGQKVLYSELAQLPSYLSDVIDKSEFKNIQNDITETNKIIAEYSQKRIDASIEYNKQLANIDEEMERKVSEIKSNNDVVKILTLTSQSLPLSMCFALQAFTEKESIDNFDEKKKLYVRELLTNFKISLLKHIKDNPGVNVDRLIESISLK